MSNTKDLKERPVQAEEVKPKSRKSVSYALKAIRVHVKTLKDGGVLDSNQETTIMEYVQGATKKFIAQEYGL